MDTCKICDKEFKNLKGLTTHTNSKHNLNGREYYDKYLKKCCEGQCLVCGMETSYRNAGVGYLVTCSIECRNNNKNIKRDYWRGRTQSKETITKRIQNTNQIKKEANRKETMLDKYGVDNPLKLENIKTLVSKKLTGKKQNRSIDWQKNIITSKRKNGTLKHSDETKSKIGDSLNKYYSLNLDREKYISNSNSHFCGWYNGLHFRSSLELSFLFMNKDVTFISCEKNEYKIIYEKDSKPKTYYPDYTDGDIIYEIKPSTLLEYKDNDLKIKKGLELYGDKYKVITEKEAPYIEKTKILELIEIGVVRVNEKTLSVLKNYKH